MSSHEHLGESGYRPDQRYDQLDDDTKTVVAAIADGRTESPQDLLAEFAAIDRLLIEALDILPGPDFPPGLPPRLQALLQADRGGTPPPDTPQN
jgi:hypothetical protein